ncbi:MAG: hypothetical protein AAGI46_01935 [Planctomycetota bacterium]
MTRAKRRTRGLIALGASGVVAALIHSGIAAPYPDLATAYLICAAVSLWGVIDLAWSLGTAEPAVEA